MHPSRKLHEAGPPSPEQVAAILAENASMHSPVVERAAFGCNERSDARVHHG
jgi:hypothetical protein